MNVFIIGITAASAVCSRRNCDAYAARLAAAGVPVTHRCEPGLLHGFVQGTGPAATAALERLAADVRAGVIGSHRPVV